MLLRLVGGPRQGRLERGAQGVDVDDGVADRVIGAFRATLYGAVIIMLGHVFLALPIAAMSWVGIATVALGTGLQKASISAVVGQLYDREDGRRDAGFSIFYMSVNIGSFCAPFVVTFLKDRWGFHAGFSAAAVGMAFGLIGLFVFRKHLHGAGTNPTSPLTAAERGTVMRRVGLGVVGVAAVRDRALAWLEAPGEPVAIREAATVMLLREVEDALEVFVLRRVPQMEFAPSVHVFPGGGIEAVDRDAAARSADRGSSDAAARVAAVREVAEETGLRLRPDELTRLGAWDTAAANEPGAALHSEVFALWRPVARHEVPEPTDEIVELHWMDPAAPAAPGGHGVAPLLHPVLAAVAAAPPF